MSERRMLSTKITESDAFLDMPLSSQALYFHLCLNADDDGVVGSPKRIARMVGAQLDDLNILLSKRFVLKLSDTVIIIKHWMTHNTIKKDRYRATPYVSLMDGIYLNQNGDYTDDPATAVSTWTPLVSRVSQVGTKLEPNWSQTGAKPVTQVKSSKDKLSKDNISSSISIIDRLTDEEYKMLTDSVIEGECVSLLDKLSEVDVDIRNPYKYCITVAKNMGVLKGGRNEHL